MKKIIVFISFSILLVIGLLIIITKNNKKVYIDINGIKYAILVDGVSSNSFPSGNYKVDISCTNADAYWNSVTSKVIIKNIKGSVMCEVAFNSITSFDYLNTYITSLSGTAQGSGQLVSENGLRYEGENPNNYVMFNNELWRIIGVFSTEYDSNNDGAADSTTNLVKIIREEYIGGIIWNKSFTNDWPNSSLYHLLNEQYYDWETNKMNVSTYCYGEYGSSTIPANCDYSVDGIQDGYRGMIAKTKWYNGGRGKTGYTGSTPDYIYTYERNPDAVYNGRSTSTLGYIGLMYGSDYLYGVLASDCVRTTTLYNTANCTGKDWLYKGCELLISPNSDTQYNVWMLNFAGYIATSSTYNSYGVRPVLYLSSSVYRVGGTGTITDPYIIGMATS